MLKTMLEEPSNNARKLVRMFHGRLFSIMDANTNKQLYVVAHLEYVCQVWDPQLIKDIHALQSVQKICFEGLHQAVGCPLSNLVELLQPPRICCKKTSDEIVHYVQANS